jgi:D-sedoheptulose 7-phosphate isomerase
MSASTGSRGLILPALEEAATVLDAVRDDVRFQDAADRFVDVAHATLAGGGTLYSCGNGGSMCDAMHFAEEWTGRFRNDRRALPAMSFSDPSHLTCIANDFGYEEVFARLVHAFARPGDALVVLSTSGNSPNVLRACAAGRERGVTVVGLLGKGGGKMLELCDVALVVPLATTSDRIQEIHIKVLHAVIEAVEARLFAA